LVCTAKTAASASVSWSGQLLQPQQQLVSCQLLVMTTPACSLSIT